MVESEIRRVYIAKEDRFLVLDVFFECSDSLRARNFDEEGAIDRVTPHPAVKHHHIWDDDDGGVSRS